MKTEQWAKDFQNHTDNPPKEGTVLRCFGNVDARLDLELDEGKPPFMYGRMYVPHIVGQELGWFLQPFDSDAAYGWKCILLPKAREEAIRRLGITEKRIKVRALKIVRYSRTGKAVLCEVAEYCPTEQAKHVLATASDEIGLSQTAGATVGRPEVVTGGPPTFLPDGADHSGVKMDELPVKSIEPSLGDDHALHVARGQINVTPGDPETDF